MKRTSLFRRIALISTSSVAIAPVVFSSTACTPTKMVADYYSFKSVADYTSGDFKPGQSSVSFKSMLYGNKKFHNGNYILISGSAYFNNVSLFFSGEEHIRQRKQWFSEQYFLNSILYNGCQIVSNSPELTEEQKDIGFYNAIDFYDGKVYDNTGTLLYVCDNNGNVRDGNIRPFEKWTDAAIRETKKYNNSDKRPGGKYDWDPDGKVTTDDYIRNDTAAQAFRAFNQLGAKLFPTSEEEGGRKVTFYTDDKSIGQLAFYKEGTLKAIEDIPSSAEWPKTISDKFADLIVQNYKTEEDPESQK